MITLATEKQLARFLETAQRAGIGVGQPATAAAQEQFGEQLSRALADGFYLDQTLPQLITTIRPVVFDARRIPFPELLPAVQNSIVRRRGWPFPFVQHPASGRDWVGERVSSMHPETWQFFESGQFLDCRHIEEYGPDSDGFLDEGQAVRGYLPIWLPLLHFTEGIEFAGRLQRACFEAEPVNVALSLHNIRRFVLVTAHRSRSGLHGPYAYNDDTWDHEIHLSPEEGLTSARALAAEAARDLLQRFGWRGVTLDLLREIQTEAFGLEPR